MGRRGYVVNPGALHFSGRERLERIGVGLSHRGATPPLRAATDRCQSVGVRIRRLRPVADTVQPAFQCLQQGTPGLTLAHSLLREGALRYYSDTTRTGNPQNPSDRSVAGRPPFLPRRHSAPATPARERWRPRLHLWPCHPASSKRCR
jgi:hypothetical protein